MPDQPLVSDDIEIIFVDETEPDAPTFWQPEPGKKPHVQHQFRGGGKQHGKKHKKNNKKQQDKPKDKNPTAEENTIYRHTQNEWSCNSCDAQGDFALTDVRHLGSFLTFKLFCMACGDINKIQSYVPTEAFRDGRIQKA